MISGTRRKLSRETSGYDVEAYCIENAKIRDARVIG
jgi:hypothetical protein